MSSRPLRIRFVRLGCGVALAALASACSSDAALTTFTPTRFVGLSALRVTATNNYNEPYVLIDNVVLNGTVVPEPATIGLVAIGLLGVGAVARRRRAAA